MARSLWGDIEYEILAVILSFLSLPDIKNCCLVCKNWYKYLCDENNEIWHAIVTKKLGKAILASDLLVDVPTFKGKLRASFYTWNSNDSSRNINIKNCGFTIRRTPIAQSTDVAKCKIGFYSGRHCWEIWWSGPLGTVAIVGIATKVAAVQCSGYVPLLGIDRESWGWNIVDNILVHDGENIGNYPYFSNSLKCQVNNVKFFSILVSGK